MENYFLKTLLYFAFTGLLTAQINSLTKDDNLFLVDSIKITGNEITKEFVILRELTFTEGDKISCSDLEYNRERVYSLGIFNFVNVFRDSILQNNVIINVSETWDIYPIPFYRIENEKVRYGVRLVWKNFRGRNEKLSAMISLGYNPYYQFIYTNPLINEENNLSFSISSIYQWIGNPSKKILQKINKDFEYKYFSNSLSIGKKFDQYNDMYLSLGYFYIETTDNFGYNVTVSNSRIDRYPFLGISFMHDTRDLKQYALYGTLFYSGYLYKGFGIDDISYSTFSVDLRQYDELWGDLSHKYRVAVRHTSGEIPLYDLSFLGHNEFVRGHKNDIREGNNVFIAGYELDFPILKEWDLELDLPLLPTRLTAARIGIHLTAFFDAGAVFDNHDKLSKIRFDKGYGVGINLLFLPHAGLRFEYAFDEQGKGEYLIGTGLSF